MRRYRKAKGENELRRTIPTAKSVFEREEATNWVLSLPVHSSFTKEDITHKLDILKGAS